MHYILNQLPDINLDDLICDNFFQNDEEYFERFPKFMKYNDNVVPCKETYACIFIGIITITKSDCFHHSRANLRVRSV